MAAYSILVFDGVRCMGYSLCRVIGLRKLFAWAISLSLLSGSLLPYAVKQTAADPDGVCGPILIAEHSVAHFEAPLAGPRDHCVFCHLWHAMAGASISSPAVVAPPVDARTTFVPRQPERIELAARDGVLLRGPPSTL